MTVERKIIVNIGLNQAGHLFVKFIHENEITGESQEDIDKQWQAMNETEQRLYNLTVALKDYSQQQVAEFLNAELISSEDIN